MGITLDKTITRDSSNTIDATTPYLELNTKSAKIVNDVVTHVEQQITIVEEAFNAVNNTVSGYEASALTSKNASASSATAANASKELAATKAIEAQNSALSAAASANYVGVYNNTNAYTVGQSVSKNSMFFRCAVSNTGKDPETEPTYWVKIPSIPQTIIETLMPLGDVAYKLGTVGEIGFGVATAPYNDYTSLGMVPLEGHTMPLSQNYGNYLHIASGSIMVYIPKHYYKIDGNTITFSDVATEGYVLDRSFINAGLEKNGIFVMKYGASSNNGIYASRKGKAPLSTSSANNPQSALLNTPANTYGGCYKAVKSMDVKAFLAPLYVYAMLARLAYAHGIAATTTTACAFIDVAPRLPKGNNNNALKDTNDVSLTFTSAGNATYPSCSLTGSASNLAKTTHNGQACGVCDLNGNMWEVASGFIRTDALGFLVLKESVDITTLTDDGTGATGAYNTALYDVLDVSSVIDVIGTSYFGNGSNVVFEFSTDRTSAAFKRTSLGLPLATGVSGSGATAFGNDGLWKNFINDLAPLCGGNWSGGSAAGVFALYLTVHRTASYYNVGSRACLYAL